MLEKSEDENSALAFPAGDLLHSRVGGSAAHNRSRSLPKLTCVKALIHNLEHNDHLNKLSADRNIISHSYLLHSRCQIYFSAFPPQFHVNGGRKYIEFEVNGCRLF